MRLTERDFDAIALLADLFNDVLLVRQLGEEVLFDTTKLTAGASPFLQVYVLYRECVLRGKKDELLRAAVRRYPNRADQLGLYLGD